MSSVTDRITRKWWAVAIVILALAGAMGVVSAVGEATRTASATDALPIGSDSAQAIELREQLPEVEGSTAVIVFSTDSGTAVAQRRPRDRGAARAGAGGRPGAAAAQPGRHGSARGRTGWRPMTPPRPPRPSSRSARPSRPTCPTGVTAQVTGPAAIQADLAAVFDGANIRLLAATASVVALLLVITYRSPILWIVPLIVVGVADRLAAVLATHTLAALRRRCGTSRRSASSRCSSSAPAPTTPCC